MAHGDYTRRRVADRRPAGGRPPRGPGMDNKSKIRNNKKIQKKPKTVSNKNQIRSTERMLRKELPFEVREALEKKLEDLKKHQEIQSRLAIEREIFLRNRRVKFFERRKIERRIRRLEKQQRAPSADQNSDATISEELAKLKGDLEYVRFFPKTVKYVSLFTGGDGADMVEKRNALRKQIKNNLIAAAASGKDLEETGSDDDGNIDVSEDDFFMDGSSSDEDADDEWTDKSASCKEPASSASGKATSGMSSDEKNQQRQISDRALMPPPHSNQHLFSGSYNQARVSNRNQKNYRVPPLSTTSNTAYRSSSTLSRNWSSNTRPDNSSNLSSNSDAHKPRRKRRPKKKKQAA